jgi:hypothetical protein
MIANQIAGIFSGASAPAVGDFDCIAFATVGGGGSSFFDFTGIPATYTHLQLRLMTKSTFAGNASALFIQFNNNTGANYAQHGLGGDGAAAFAYAVTSATATGGGFSAGSTASNTFGVAVADILDYKDANKYKTMRLMSGADFNGSGQIRMVSGLWQNTAAITSIKIYDANGGTLSQYSHAALYGIK